MASLIIAGSILLHNKIRDKKEAKREKKLRAYEDRYNELQREHSQHEEKQIQRRKTGDSTTQEPVTMTRRRNPFGNPVEEGGRDEKQEGLRRTSVDSGHTSGDDGPSRWVDEVSRARVKT